MGFMKTTTTLTLHGFRPKLHEDLMEGARSNRRSLNEEALARLEGQEPEIKPVTCAEAAEILRLADKMLTPTDRAQIVSGVEQARRHMHNEHLH